MDVVGRAEVRVEGYEGFFAVAEPRLRRALVARYGLDRGPEATAEALAWGFEHWDRLRAMENPTGYLYRVGGTKARGRRRRVLFDTPQQPGEPDVEPELAVALTRLSANQRAAVVLVKGYGWQLHEVAELTGSSISTVNTHVRRGLAKLRTELGVEP
jgi:DNA-directed RNA polymerase specialized sigma24 family protein